MSELVFSRRGLEMLRFRVGDAPVVVGRGDGCDVVIPDESVSRRQFVLMPAAGKAFIEDVSGHGTTVLGQPIRQRIELSDGTDIALGQWVAVWRERASEDDLDAAGEMTVRGHAETVRAEPSEAAAQDAQSRGRAQLKIRFGDKETVHLIGSGPLVLGKDAGNDVVLDDPFVSGKHLRLVPNVPSAGLFHLVDLQSTNGTYLGGSRVYEADIPFFTPIRLGGTEVVVEPVSSSSAKAGTQLVGRSPALRQLLEVIGRIAPSSASVAVLGESGTGKELVARAIHFGSARAEKAFIPVNCAAISKTLIESELFGHEKGAFTGAVTSRKGAFEEADGGTLFLDEVGELSPDLQATLLRALESGEVRRVGASKPITVNVRLVTATNVDLLTAVQERRFREDLYYRICVVPVHVPPLRSRKSDIVELAKHFVRAFSTRGFVARFTPSAMERLEKYDWPGNVRELRNVVQRGILLRKGASIDVDDIVFDRPSSPKPEARPISLRAGMSLAETMEAIEREIIEDCLRRHGGSRDLAAKELGLARSAFFKRLNEWGLTGKDED